MTRKGIMGALLAVAALAAAPAAAQVSVASTSYRNMPVLDYTYDFDTRSPVTTGGALRSPPSSPVGAVPLGSTGNYFSVGPSTGGLATISFADFGKPISAVSFLWGSTDPYNLIQFFGPTGALGRLYTGLDVGAPADGSQSAEYSNRWVTFNFTGPLAQSVTGMRIRSNVEATEVDNIQLTAAVPEPATWALMLLGFGMVGAGLRRRRGEDELVTA